MYPEVNFLSYEVSTYLALNLAALAATALLLRHELGRHGYPPRFYPKLLAALVVGLFVGAKLYYLLENWEQVGPDAWRTLLSASGSRWYGGFVVGGLAAIVTIRRAGLPVLRTLDLLAPILPLSQAIGRLGCFLGGCCHGIPSSAPWALAFPSGLYPPYVRVHPTQLYEMAVYLAAFGLLWKTRDRLAPGHPLGLYLLLAGGGRFLSEIWRLNPKIVYGHSVAQMLALASMLVGAALLLRPARAKPIGGT